MRAKSLISGQYSTGGNGEGQCQREGAAGLAIPGAPHPNPGSLPGRFRVPGHRRLSWPPLLHAPRRPQPPAASPRRPHSPSSPHSFPRPSREPPNPAISPGPLPIGPCRLPRRSRASPHSASPGVHSPVPGASPGDPPTPSPPRAPPTPAPRDSLRDPGHTHPATARPYLTLRPPQPPPTIPGTSLSPAPPAAAPHRC